MNPYSFLSTRDLVLRPFVMSDAPALFAYACDKRVTQFTCWDSHTRVADSYRFIKHHKESLLWAIIHQKTTHLIGECRLTYTSCSTAEIHCALHPAMWGKGFATQALTALVNVGFQELELTALYASIITDNYRCLNLVQTIGMNYIGNLPHQWYLNGSLHTVAHYEIKKDSVIKT